MKGKLALVAILAGSATSSAFAGFQNTFQVQISWGSGSWGADSSSMQVTQTEEGTWLASGSASNSIFDAAWSIEFDDTGASVSRGGGFGFVSSAFTVTNTSAVTDNFTVTVFSALTGPIGPPTSIRGSISGNVTDRSPDLAGATLSNFGGNPLYEGLFDGATARTLYNAPFNVVVPGLALTTVVPTQSFGVPAFEPNAGGAVAFIGIRNSFSLTPDDSVGLGSTFLVIPAPGAAALFGLTSLVALRRRR